MDYFIYLSSHASLPTTGNLQAGFIFRKKYSYKIGLWYKLERSSSFQQKSKSSQDDRLVVIEIIWWFLISIFKYEGGINKKHVPSFIGFKTLRKISSVQTFPPIISIFRMDNSVHCNYGFSYLNQWWERWLLSIPDHIAA